jgi:hypothetical protein
MQERPMFYEPSIYRVYTALSLHVPSDVFELYPGGFTGAVTFCNPGSIYIREEGFRPFGPMIRAVAPRFQWWGEIRIAGAQLTKLSSLLDGLRIGVRQAQSASDLRQLNAHIDVDDAAFLAVKSLLTRAVEEIDHLVWLAAGRRHGLWIIGP